MAKYRVSANLIWDVEGSEATIAESKAMEQLIQMAKSAGVRLRRPKISLNKLKELTNSTILAEYPPDEILSILSTDGHRKEFNIGGQVYKVKMNSQRYFCFSENKKCVACGVEGSKILLELPHGVEYPHFNLYAEENGELVLMTKDHKLPVALGGRDVMENYQTMCAICNNIKGKDILSLQDIKILRGIHNKCVAEHATSNQMYKMIQEEKIRLLDAKRKPVSVNRQIVVGPTFTKKVKFMPFSPTSGVKRFMLFFVIVLTILGLLFFSPTCAGISLVLAILGYYAGTLK